MEKSNEVREVSRRGVLSCYWLMHGWIIGGQLWQAVRRALDIGYRLIDTAWAYKNQSSIGRALRKSSIPRSEIFISTKIWRDNLNYDGVIEQCGQILNQLQVDYVDLLLTHWPSDAHIRARHEPTNITPLE